MKKISSGLLLLLACFTIHTSGQDKFEIKFFEKVRNDRGIAYNFFLGNDADDMETTINGFGSGFILDVYTGRYSVDFMTLGTKTINLSFGVGIGITKYRFSNNLIISNTETNIEVMIDDDPNRDYGNGFFSHGKSKMMYGSVYFPVNINLSVKDVYISAGVLMDQYLIGRLKRKYKEDGQKQKTIVDNSKFKNYFINKTKYGINALIKHKKSPFGLSCTYFFTPFFEDGKGPEINEIRISFNYNLEFFEKMTNPMNKNRKTNI